MTNNQLFFYLVGVLAGLAFFFKLYLDVKIGPIKEHLDMLVQYMMLHELKIADFEEWRKNL